MSFYFQRYSKKENVITNSTLMLLNYIYQQSPIKLQTIFQEFGIEINIGLDFINQKSEGNDNKKSILDGYISQKSFNIYIEAKLGNENTPQLVNHLENIAKVQNATLICLTKSEVLDKDKLPKVIYITYSKIIDIVNDQIEEWETQLQEIVDDYQALLKENGLLIDPLIMFASPAGQTMEVNKNTGVYYDEIYRPTRAGASYIGMYSNKAIRLIGKIEAVIIYDSVNYIAERGEVNEENIQKIKNSLELSKPIYGDITNKPMRFFITDFKEVNFTKDTHRGMHGLTYFKLKDYGVKISDTIDDIVNKLNEKQWKRK